MFNEKTLNLLVKEITGHLVTYYQVPIKLAKRYSLLLICRWVRFGLENELDAGCISEDLYQETENWETPDYMPEGIRYLVKMKLPFPNLDYSEETELKDIKKQLKEQKDHKCKQSNSSSS